MEISQQRIMVLRRMMGQKTQKEFADEFGLDASYVSQMLNGHRKMGEKAAAKLELLLGVPSGTFVSPSIHEESSVEKQDHANVRPARAPHKEAKGYPLISWIIAGEWAESCDNFQPGAAEEWYTSEASAGPKGYWLEVEGDSMIAPPGSGYSFTPGTLILVRPEGFDLVSGKLYVAKMLDTGETTFKVYVRDFGASYLKPLNPAFRTLEMTDNVQIIGRVVDARPPRSVF